eukprot:m.304616 g.304616  ORF g.304616 m.304616 type:complete len:253 (+) comp55272_c0_seq4:875-1633(+)
MAHQAALTRAQADKAELQAALAAEQTGARALRTSLAAEQQRALAERELRIAHEANIKTLQTELDQAQSSIADLNQARESLDRQLQQQVIERIQRGDPCVGAHWAALARYWKLKVAIDDSLTVDETRGRTISLLAHTLQCSFGDASFFKVSLLQAVSQRRIAQPRCRQTTQLILILEQAACEHLLEAFRSVDVDDDTIFFVDLDDLCSLDSRFRAHKPALIEAIAARAALREPLQASSFESENLLIPIHSALP